MGTKIFIALMVILFTLFFLSVFGPMHSKKKFWKAIYKIRNGMDLASYWFFNVCGIATIAVIFYFVVIKRFFGV